MVIDADVGVEPMILKIRNNPVLSSREWIGTWTYSAIFTKQNYWSKSFEENRPWSFS